MLQSHTSAAADFIMDSGDVPFMASRSAVCECVYRRRHRACGYSCYFQGL
jgi:hypothetical protein